MEKLIPENLIHTVFFSTIPDEADFHMLFKKFSGYLSADSTERIKAMKRTETAAGSLMAELIPKVMLSKYAGIPLNDIDIIKEESGKPRFLKQQHIYYNISHSGNYVICAFADKDVGIDIEKIRTINPEIARRFFTKNEQDYIFNDASESYEKRFFTIWTLKESYLKALGKGLRKSLGSFSVVNNKGEFMLTEEKGETGFRCNHNLFKKDYVYSICSLDTIKRKLKKTDIHDWMASIS